MSGEEKYSRILKYSKLRGLNFPVHSLIIKDFAEAAMDYRQKDKDIVVLSYPKTGSTWLMYTIWEILHKGKACDNVMEMHLDYAPRIELTGPHTVEVLSEPRFYCSHFPCEYIKMNKSAKYVYIHRKPDDVLVSYYHFNKLFSDEDFEFNFFFEAFIAGNVYFGDFFDHVLSALKHKDDDNFLIVSYENLKENRQDEVLRIAKFLGDEYESRLKDRNVIERLLDSTSFEYMKNNFRFEIPDQRRTLIPFFRKGVTGDGKNYLSEEQQRKLNKKIVEKMKGTDLLEAWLV